MPSESNPLVDAVQRGDVALCRELIAQGVDVNQTSEGESPVIHWAVFYDQREVIKLLLDAGADVNDPCKCCRKRALNWAIRRGVATETLEFLLNAGAQVNYLTFAAESPLLEAVERDRLDFARILVERGARSSLMPALPLPKTRTAFQEAIYTGRGDFVELFARKCGEDFDQVTAAGQTLMELASADPTMQALLCSLRTELGLQEVLVDDEAVGQSSGPVAPRSSSLAL